MNWVSSDFPERDTRASRCGTSPPGESPIARGCWPQTAPMVVCPVCVHVGRTFAFAAEDHQLGVPGVWRYSKCERCRTVYQDPCVIPQDLPLCYKGEYFTHELPAVAPIVSERASGSTRNRVREAIRHYADGCPSSEESVLVRFAGMILSRVPAIRRRARLGLPDSLATDGVSQPRCLEVGPGRGCELRQLRQIGWNAVGLDLDPAAAEVAQRISGCDVYQGSIISADFATKSFDLIYMNHVVEHLCDFRQCLARCFEWLTDSGRLVLVYPNPGSLANLRWGRFSRNWDAPRHLVFPPTQAMRQVLHRTGFSKVTITTSSRLALASCALSRHFSVGNRGWRGVNAPRLSDHALAFLEMIAVALGLHVGEEVHVTARK